MQWSFLPSMMARKFWRASGAQGSKLTPESTRWRWESARDSFAGKRSRLIPAGAQPFLNRYGGIASYGIVSLTPRWSVLELLKALGSNGLKVCWQ